MDQTSKDNSRVIEISTPDFKDSGVASYFAQCLIATPYFICKKSGEPAAEIKSIIVQPNIFICELHISEEDLEINFDDIQYVYDNYKESDFSYIFNFQ